MNELLNFILKEKQTMEELDTSPYVLIDKIIEKLKNEEEIPDSLIAQAETNIGM